MTQPPPPPPPPPPPLPPQSQGGGGFQVRCAGCRLILKVAPGIVEFVCPTCQLPQMLPPELLSSTRPHPISTTASASASNPNVANNNPAPGPGGAGTHVPAHGIDPTKIQLPCANCKALLNVPHGLTRFSCPQCRADLAVDLSKVKHFFPLPRPPLAPHPPPPPEELNEVAIEVEREEEEGGPVGETFTDYVNSLFQFLLGEILMCSKSTMSSVLF